MNGPLQGQMLNRGNHNHAGRHFQNANVYQEASFLLAFGLLLSAFPALAEEYNGKVVGITDGDTLTLLTAEKRQLKVRLAEIDTPERNQPYGSRAQQALADLAFNREARVVVVDHDRYGRVVGRVHVGNVDVNAELVRQGAAWVYRDYGPRSHTVCPGGRSTRSEAWLVGAARGAKNATVGMAAGEPGG